MNQSAEPQEKSEGLPFDPFAVLQGLRSKKKWIVLTLVIAIAGGVAAGVLLGKRSWDSYCVMLYQPPSVELSGRVYDAPVVQTQLNLVKLRRNLEATRDRLRLPISLESLASACDITNPRDTQLLIIKGTADAATRSASIANTLAEVFIENQRMVRNDELSDALGYLEGRKQDLADKLNRVQKESEGAAMKEPEDLEREIRSHQTKLDALDVIYEKALSERKSLEIQNERVASITEEVKQKIADEQNEAAAVQGLSNMNIRVERIREAIMDERSEQTNDITLSQWKNRLDYDKQLLDKGYLSKAVYDHELAQYEKLKAQAVDSEKILAWKEELDDLYQKIRPNDKKETASAPILRDLMLRTFNLELQLKGINEHIIKTKESRDAIAADFEKLLASRNTSGAERWQVQSWRDELSDVDKSIAMVRSLQTSGTSDFQIVSPAEASPLPSKSNRRLLAIGTTGMLGMFGMALIVSTELLQTRVRTCDEVSKLIDQPVIAAITRQAEAEKALDTDATEQVRRATRSIMQATDGRRVLLLGCRHGDGCSTLTQQIAECLARQQRRVTILEGDLRSPEASLSERYGVDPESVGLSDLMHDSSTPVLESVHRTGVEHLNFVPRGSESMDPDLLGSERMRDIVSDLQADSDYLLIDGPPLSDYTDAEFLTENADAVLLVVRSRQCSRSQVKQAAERIRKSGKQLVGVILNDIDPRYLRKV